LASSPRAFLIDDELFDRAYARLQSKGIEHWAGPQMKRPRQINTEHIRCQSPSTSVHEPIGSNFRRNSLRSTGYLRCNRMSGVT
jgi:hypothetical protein